MGKLVIVGGLGYVGGRIAKHFSDIGRWKVVATTRGEGVSAPNWLQGEVVKADIEDGDALADIFSDAQAVIHLAAMNEIESGKDPLRAAAVNGTGTLNVLSAAIRANVPRFIYFSTAHVYGSPLQGHLVESVLPAPVHPYAISHRNAEDWVLAEQLKGSIATCVMRLSNAIGPPASTHANRWTLLVNDLCRQAATHGTLTLRSAGYDLRNFITLSDVAKAAEHMLALTDSEWNNGLFNLGGDLTCSVLEMAERISYLAAELLGEKISFHRPNKPVPQATPHLNYDCSRLTATGFARLDDYDQAIKDTLTYCMNQFTRS